MSLPAFAQDQLRCIAGGESTTLRTNIDPSTNLRSLTHPNASSINCSSSRDYGQSGINRYFCDSFPIPPNADLNQPVQLSVQTGETQASNTNDSLVAGSYDGNNWQISQTLFSGNAPSTPTTFSTIFPGGTFQNTPSFNGSQVIDMFMQDDTTIASASLQYCLTPPPPDLSVRKSVSNPQPYYLPGDTISFEITVTNSGGAVQANQTVAIMDHLPSSLTFAGLPTGSNWSCSGAVCQYGGAVGANATLPPVRVDAIVNDPTPSGVYQNCGLVNQRRAGSSPTPSSELPTFLRPWEHQCIPFTVKNEVPYWVYSAKYVCGNANKVEDEARDIVAGGQYRTEINILNNSTNLTRLVKEVLPLVRAGQKVIREPDQIGEQGGESFNLRPVHATMDDCRKIGEMLDREGLAERPISIGFLNIWSQEELIVDGVYTTNLELSGSPSMDVERIEGRHMLRIE